MGRLHKAALLCALALALLTLPLGAAAKAPEPGHAGVALQTLGDTALSALASSTGADRALGALGNGLALIEARRRIEAKPESTYGSAVPATPPGPAVAGGPSTMPPASAGSNGTAVQRHSALDGQKIFAH
ncbi:MAG: hypothetical protein JWM24_697, partial [Solirubrobacterales bacterium]|nr:hypothetical protein [Solirubrobacterales bacterium]